MVRSADPTSPPTLQLWVKPVELDSRGGGKVDGEQLLDLASPILAGALRAAGGPPPAQERGEEHEDRRGAVAFVLVILAQRRAGRHGQRQAELAVEFLAGLVHDDQRD